MTLLQNLYSFPEHIIFIDFAAMKNARVALCSLLTLAFAGYRPLIGLLLLLPAAAPDFHARAGL
jgi:hypothetical protein